MTAARAAVERLLDNDEAYYARKCLKIEGPGGAIVSFEPKPAQQRLYAAIREQRDAGLPERVAIVKARKLGFSTATQGVLIQRTTRRENHNALVVAHDRRTAGVVFRIGKLMHTRLPAEIRPPIVTERDTLEVKTLVFGEPSRLARRQGDLGLNSSIEVVTASEAEGGRGYTIRSLHLSEVAFYRKPEALTSLMNAVPDEPGTLVVVESTAKGLNHFKRICDAARDGSSGYALVFAPWHEEEAYRLEFASEEAREEFVASIGTGPWGEDEARLVSEFGCSPEQLAWRRRTIVARCEGKLERWNAEYPASYEDAFVATGRHRFSLVFVRSMLAVAEREDAKAEAGLLTAGTEVTRRLGGEEFPVPTSALWTPRSATGFGDGYSWWRIWTHPERQTTVGELRRLLHAGALEQAPFDRRLSLVPEAHLAARGDAASVPEGQYVIGVDVMGGEEDDDGERAWHAIQVIDHRTLQQVAEYRSRVEAYLLAEQCLLAGLYWNTAWLAVEITGSWGLPVVKDYLHRKYRYRRLYRRAKVDAGSDEPRDALGWDTTRRTKPLLEAGYEELLKEGSSGVRSLVLGDEHMTYVRDANGRTGPESGHFSDLLMAYMIAQQVAREKRVRIVTGSSVGSTAYAGSANGRTGY